MKKLNLINLQSKSLDNQQLQSVKGGGVCSCRSQGVERRTYGQRRGAVLEEMKR